MSRFIAIKHSSTASGGKKDKKKKWTATVGRQEKGDKKLPWFSWARNAAGTWLSCHHGRYRWWISQTKAVYDTQLYVVKLNQIQTVVCNAIPPEFLSYHNGGFWRAPGPWQPCQEQGAATSSPSRGVEWNGFTPIIAKSSARSKVLPAKCGKIAPTGTTLPSE